MKILILSGHTANGYDQGVNAWNSETEGAINYKLAEKLKQKLQLCNDVMADIWEEKQQGSNSFNVNANMINEYDLTISLHHNGFDSSATGAEVIYLSENNKAFASKMSEVVANTLNITDRGAKYRDNLYILNQGADILIESCFVDNPSDYGDNYNIDKLATVIADVIALERGLNMDNLELNTLEGNINTDNLELLVDGRNVTVKGLNFNGYGCITLRDMAKIFGKEISYDNATGITTIE